MTYQEKRAAGLVIMQLWLPAEMKKKLKLKAVEKDKTIENLIREFIATGLTQGE